MGNDRSEFSEVRNLSRKEARNRKRQKSASQGWKANKKVRKEDEYALQEV
jgi:hypothetical protein